MPGENGNHHTDERRGHERRRRRRLVLIERRSGFDRRGPASGGRLSGALEGALLRLRDDPVLLLAVLGLANMLSLADLAFTLFALDHGAIEANPVMRTLLDSDPGFAILAKIGMVAGVSTLIYLLRRYRLMLMVALIAVAVFGSVVVYHLFGLTRLALV